MCQKLSSVMNPPPLSPLPFAHGPWSKLYFEREKNTFLKSNTLNYRFFVSKFIVSVTIGKYEVNYATIHLCKTNKNIFLYPLLPLPPLNSRFDYGSIMCIHFIPCWLILCCKLVLIVLVQFLYFYFFSL